MLAGRREDHARLGLAAVASDGVPSHNSFGVMRAIVKARQGYAKIRQQSCKTLVHGGQSLLSEKSPRDSRLIRDHDQQETGGAKPRQPRRGPWPEANARSGSTL